MAIKDVAEAAVEVAELLQDAKDYGKVPANASHVASSGNVSEATRDGDNTYFRVLVNHTITFSKMYEGKIDVKNDVSYTEVE